MQDIDCLAAAARVIPRLLAGGWTLATAESVTGGGFHFYATSVPGASAAVLGGANVYTAATKRSLAGIDPQVLALHGTVAAATSLGLAIAIRERTGADFALAVTGNAGPSGGTREHPIGRVYWALVGPAGVREAQHDFEGDRHTVRMAAIVAGFQLLAGALPDEPGQHGSGT